MYNFNMGQSNFLSLYWIFHYRMDIEVCKMINVLITTAGSVSGVNCINALKNQDELKIRLITTDVSEYAAGRYLSDRFYLVPPFEKEQEYIDALLAICKKESIDVLLPTFSIEIPIIAKFIEEFRSQKINICISPFSSIELFKDKWASYQFFKHNNIDTPNTWLLKDMGNTTQPMYIKPIVGSGSRKNHIVHSNADLLALKSIIKQDEYIAQPLIQAPEFTVDVLSDYENNILSIVPRERIITKDGLAIVSRTVGELDINESIEIIVSKGKLVGAFNIQYFKIHENKFLIMDVNTRFAAGGLPLSIKSGINSPLVILKLALGQKVQKNMNYKKNIVMIRYYTELFLDPS